MNNADDQDRHSATPFLLLCVISFAVFFGSYIRIPVLPLLAVTLGASPAQIGGINGSFMLTAALLSIPAGLLVDRTGHRFPIIAGITAMAISSFLVTQCRFPGQMAASYVLFGVGMAAFAPSMLSLVTNVIPSDRLYQTFALYTTTIFIAQTLGPAFGGYLAKELGFRQVFGVSGALLTVVILLALLFLPKGSSRHKTDLDSVLASSFVLLRSHRLIACLLATIGANFGFGVFLTFFPLYASQCNYNPGQIGLVFAAHALTNVIGRVPIGIISNRFDRRWMVSVGLICQAVALIAIGQLIQFSHMLVCAVAFGVGMVLIFTTVGALIVESVPAVQRGLAMGLYNSCIYLGMMSGSIVMGIALNRLGFPLCFAAAGFVSLASSVLFFLTMRKKLPSNSCP